MITQEEILEKLDDATKLCVGREYFINAARLIQELSEADYTFLTRVDPETKVASPIISMKHGEIIDNIEYKMDHAPCLEVTESCVGYYPTDVQNLFPKDEYFKVIDVDGYIGASVFTYGQDTPFGIITCLYEKKPKDPVKNLAIIEFIAKSIESRMEREYLISENYELKKSDKEKGLLLKEIHHRVKNNLQIVSSLLNLQKNQIRDEHTAQVLDICRSRVQSMAMVHEMLYNSNDFKTADIEEYVLTLVDYSMPKDNNNDPIINVDFEYDPIDIDTLVPLGLILSECISNFYKYAYNKNPRLDISWAKDNSIRTITIKDFGDGFPDVILSGKYESLGMELIDSLVEQINGKLRLFNDGGAVVEITFEIE